MPVPFGSAGAVAQYTFDVVVVGGGVAGLCAAVTAREAGAGVVLLEKAPREQRGGNTRFADAQMRFPHEADEFGPRDYSADDMFNDLMRISRGRANEDLIRTLCDNARQTADWLTGLGLEWEQGYPHTAGYRRSPKSGGAGLVDLLHRRLEGLGGTVSYETAATELIVDETRRIRGVRAHSPEGVVDVFGTGGVILACGGFQANVEMRVRYLGRYADSLILRGVKSLPVAL